MKHFKTLVVLVFVSLFALAGRAATLEINGVQLDDNITVNGTQLQLNGAGTRYKAGLFKVYVDGLYLVKKVKTSEEVVDQPGPKRMSVTMLRDIDADELGKLMTRGIEDNMGKSSLSKLIPGLLRMGQLFAAQKKLLAGDNFLIDWVPGVGTVLTVKGVVQGEPFKEPEFFKALMSIWLGPVPADFKLKEALLKG
ncbi:MAG TPA: chalcone isomerase family protein [Rhodoferax sp.]